MKIFKLIVLMLCMTSLLSAQTQTVMGEFAGINGGSYSTYYGYAAGQISTSNAEGNVLIGGRTGMTTTTGSYNAVLGYAALTNNTTGGYNVALGTSAGSSNTTGTFNVFIGRNAGSSLTNVSNQLYIQNSEDITTPLIYGDFATKQLGIGTSHVPTDPDTNIPYTLAVNGKTLTEEVQVMVRSTWPDYVFAEDYKLMSLTDLETEIETLGHLPGVPSAEEVETNGHALGRMDAILLEKIEELTLHLIDINKEVKDLRKENTALKNEIKAQKK